MRSLLAANDLYSSTLTSEEATSKVATRFALCAPVFFRFPQMFFWQFGLLGNRGNVASSQGAILGSGDARKDASVLST